MSTPYLPRPSRAPRGASRSYSYPGPGPTIHANSPADEQARRAAIAQAWQAGRPVGGQTSLADAQAAAAGTHATGPSFDFMQTKANADAAAAGGNTVPKGWAQAFPKVGGVARNSLPGRATPTAGKADKAQPAPGAATPAQGNAAPVTSAGPNSNVRGIANPPPMTNFRPGDAGAHSLADHVLVRNRPAPVGHAITGNKTVDDANQKADLAANRDWVRNTTERVPNPRPSDQGPDLNSAAVQGALNAANGGGVVRPTPSPQGPTASGAPLPAAAPGNTLYSTYGTGSSRQAAPSESVELQGPSKTGGSMGRVPVMAAATTAAGVVRPDWQQQVMDKYPSIKDGKHDDNKAYGQAYRDAVATHGAGNFDPVTLADQVMGNQANQRTAEAAQDATDANEAQVKNFWDTSAKIPQTPRDVGDSRMNIGDHGVSLPALSAPVTPSPQTDLGNGLSWDSPPTASLGAGLSMNRSPDSPPSASLGKPTIGTPVAPVPPVPKVPNGTGSGTNFGIPGAGSDTGDSSGKGSAVTGNSWMPAGSDPAVNPKNYLMTASLTSSSTSSAGTPAASNAPAAEPTPAPASVSPPPSVTTSVS